MISDLCLYFAGLILSFTLQITAAYFTCSLVNRMLARPRQRFRIWLAFISGTAIYWLGLVCWPLLSWAGGPESATKAGGSSAISSSFLVPLSWSPAVVRASEVLVFSYVATVAVLVSVNAWRQLRLRMLLRKGWAASEPVVSLFNQIRDELGIGRCELLVLPGLASPATAGWLHPRVLLPAVCEELGPTTRLADVLHHELEHVARRDYFWAGLSDLICRILFFHPAVWRARKLARFQGELACDLAVVEARPDHRVDYADSLAYFVRLRMMMEEQAVPGIDFAASAPTLGTRIRLILAGSPAQPGWRRIPQRAAALALVVAFAIAAPALTISIVFFRPLSEVAMSSPKAPSSALPTRHRPLVSNAKAELLPVTDLNTLRVRNSFPTTTAYSLTASSSGGGGDSSERLDRPWKESNPSFSHPSLATVIRDSVAIAVSHSDHDHDRSRNASH